MTAGHDGCLKLWQWDQESLTLEWKKDLAQLESPVSSLAWTGDASRLVAVTGGGQIMLVPIAEDETVDSGVTIGDLSLQTILLDRTQFCLRAISARRGITS